MTYNVRIETLLCYHTLTAPLDPNPISEIDKTINKLRLKYRTYYVEFDDDYTLACQGFCEDTLDKKTTALVMVDDCGNTWNFILIYGETPFKHFRIGGGWNRMMKARKIPVGTSIKVGAPMAGSNETIYLNVFRF